MSDDILSPKDKRSQVEDKDATASGFHQLVGNALRAQASYRSNNQSTWPYGRHVCGHLLDGQKRIVWECVEIEIDGTVKVGFRKVGKCSNTTSIGRTCKGCTGSKSELFKICRREFQGKDESFGGRIDQMELKSPTVLTARVRNDAEKIRALNIKNKKLTQAIEKMKAKEQNNTPSVTVDSLRRDEREFKRQYEEIMSKEEDIEKKEVFVF